MTNSEYSGIYYAVVERPDDTDTKYGAWFPQVQGCITMADTHSQLLSKCQTALSVYFEAVEAQRLEGTNVAAPLRITEAEAETLASDDIAEGAYILAVSYEHKITSSLVAKM